MSAGRLFALLIVVMSVAMGCSHSQPDNGVLRWELQEYLERKAVEVRALRSELSDAEIEWEKIKASDDKDSIYKHRVDELKKQAERLEHQYLSAYNALQKILGDETDKFVVHPRLVRFTE